METFYHRTLSSLSSSPSSSFYLVIIVCSALINITFFFFPPILSPSSKKYKKMESKLKEKSWCRVDRWMDGHIMAMSSKKLLFAFTYLPGTLETPPPKKKEA